MRPALMAGIGPGFAAEAVALFARMSTLPSNARKTAINTLISSLKSGGAWSKLEALQVYAAADSQAAGLNWLSASYTAVNSGATFTADRGYAGNGTSTDLATGFNPSLSSFSALNDASFGYWENTGYVATVSNNANGAYDGQSSQVCFQASSPFLTSASANVQGTYPGWGPTNISTVPHGPLSPTRASSTEVKLYCDGLLAATNSSLSSSTRPNSQFRVGSLSGVIWNSRQSAAFWHGKSMDATQQAVISAALRVYMQAVGNWATPAVGWGDSLSNVSYYAAMANAGWVAGRPWRRSVSQGVSAQSSAAIAARCVADTTYTGRDYVHVLWLGRNDISNTAQTVDSSGIQARIAECVTAVNNRSGKYIVVGLTPANLNAPTGSVFTNSEASGTTIGVAIAAHNSALSSTYGALFLDMRQALIDYTNANLSGSDLTDASNGLPGRSLYNSDNTGVHFGSTAFSAGFLAVGGAIDAKLLALSF